MLNRHKSSTEYNLAFQEVRPSSDNLEVRLKVFDQTGEVEVVARREGLARLLSTSLELYRTDLEVARDRVRGLAGKTVDLGVSKEEGSFSVVYSRIVLSS